MIKLLTGAQGTGKTQRLVNLANELSKTSKGDIVFIDDDNRHMYDVNNKVRFINIKEFPIDNMDSCIGFLSGIISGNYDIENILIDGLYKVLNTEINDMDLAIKKLEKLSELFNVDFYITASASELPEEFKKYLF